MSVYTCLIYFLGYTWMLHRALLCSAEVLKNSQNFGQKMIHNLFYLDENYKYDTLSEQRCTIAIEELMTTRTIGEELAHIAPFPRRFRCS